MLLQLGVLMMFQCAGQALVAASGIPFPGSLCGMLMLLAWLAWRGGPGEDLARVSAVLVDHLGLLFVPAGAAIGTCAALFAQDGIAIAAALLSSTVAGVLVSSLAAAHAMAAARKRERIA